jgi:hypothetical protein
MKTKFYTIIFICVSLIATQMKAQLAGDFRSAASGNWSTAATWEKFDGTSWAAAPAAPALADVAINIMTGHTVAMDATMSIDSVLVLTGGIVNINTGIIITNPNTGLAGFKVSGTLNVNGKILNQGGGSVNIGGSVNFNNGSEYEHAANGGAIIMSTWNIGSLCNITTVTSNRPSNSNQNFHNFTWNCPGQTANLDMGWSNNIITGKVKLISSSTFQFRLTNQGANAGSDITLNLNDIEVNSGTLTISGSSTARNYTVNVNGDINIFGNGVFSLGGSNLVATNLYLKGNLNITSTSASAYTGGQANRKTYFSKTGTQIYNAPNSATVAAISTTHNFEVSAGSILDLGSGVITNGAGNFVVNPFGGLATSGINGLNTNFTTSNVGFTLSLNTQGNYTFNGTTNQFTGTKFSIPQCNNLTINNTGAALSDTVKLSLPLTVDGVLTLTDGLLLPSTTNTLTVSPNGTIAGGGSGSYIAKRVSVNTSSTNPYIVPVGKGLNYRPVTITPETNTPTTFEVEYYNTPAPSLTPVTAPVLSVETTEYWDIGRTAGTAKATIKLPISNTITGSTSSTKAGVAHFVGGTWVWEGGSATAPGNIATGTVSTAYVNSFSPFTLAVLDNATLPVSLLNFTVSYNGSSTAINWSTTNEIAISKYIVEKSNDGVSFTTLGTVLANNSILTNNYTYNDASILVSKVYYRIKTIELDGTAKYTKILSLNAKPKNGIQVYPNPAASFVTVVTEKASKANNLQIVDAQGKIVKTVLVEAGAIQTSIFIGNLPTGNYFVKNTASQKSIAFTKE